MNESSESLDDELGEMLSNAMRSRPGPRAIPGLAKLAMARVAAIRGQRADASSSGAELLQLAILARQRRRGMLFNLAAAVVILVMVLACLRPISPNYGLSAGQQTAAVQDADSGSTSSAPLLGMSGEELVMVGISALVGIVLLLTVERDLFDPRSCLAVWGAEVAPSIAR
jgi:hypothetical protein